MDFKGSCTICSVNYTSLSHAVQHEKGKQHQKNLKRSALGAGTTPNNPVSNHAIVDVKTEYEDQTRCNICNVAFTSQSHAVQHLSGKPHRKKVESLKACSSDVSPSPEIAESKNKFEYDYSKGMPDKVFEYDKYTETGKCFICQVDFSSAVMAKMHLNGKKHISTIKKIEFFSRSELKSEDPVVQVLKDSKIGLKNFGQFDYDDDNDDDDMESSDSSLLNELEPYKILSRKEETNDQFRGIKLVTQKFVNGSLFYECNVCKIVVNTMEMFRVHADGTKHRKKLAQYTSKLENSPLIPSKRHFESESDDAMLAWKKATKMKLVEDLELMEIDENSVIPRFKEEKEFKIRKIDIADKENNTEELKWNKLVDYDEKIAKNIKKLIKKLPESKGFYKQTKIPQSIRGLLVEVVEEEEEDDNAMEARRKKIQERLKMLKKQKGGINDSVEPSSSTSLDNTVSEVDLELQVNEISSTTDVNEFEKPSESLTNGKVENSLQKLQSAPKRSTEITDDFKLPAINEEIITDEFYEKLEVDDKKLKTVLLNSEPIAGLSPDTAFERRTINNYNTGSLLSGVLRNISKEIMNNDNTNLSLSSVLSDTGVTDWTPLKSYNLWNPNPQGPIEAPSKEKTLSKSISDSSLSPTGEYSPWGNPVTTTGGSINYPVEVPSRPIRGRIQNVKVTMSTQSLPDDHYKAYDYAESECSLSVASFKSARVLGYNIPPNDLSAPNNVLEPKNQHLDSGIQVIDDGYSAMSENVTQFSQIEAVNQFAQDCPQPSCQFHCKLCDTHLSGFDPMKRHTVSDKHLRNLRARNPSNTLTNAPSSLDSWYSADSGAMSMSASSDISVASAKCNHSGCYFHCAVCDVHLSGDQPKKQHLVSEKHKKMVNRTVPGSNAKIQKVDVDVKCNHPGCYFHCKVCDVHLSGEGPKQQHITSEKHKKVANVKTLVKPGSEVPQAGIPNDVTKSPPIASSQPESMSQIPIPSACDFPGCFFHCHVCEKHISGEAPYKQHITSTKHLKAAKTANQLRGASSSPIPQSTPSIPTQPVSAAQTSILVPKTEPSPVTIGNGSRTTPSSADYVAPSMSLPVPGKSTFGINCTNSGCFYHCDICDLHLSGETPKTQHMQSSKHMKKEKAYGIGNSMKLDDTALAQGLPAQISANSQNISAPASASFPGYSTRMSTGMQASSSQGRAGSPGGLAQGSRSQPKLFATDLQVSEQLPSGIRAYCDFPACMYHCDICDSHLNGEEPKKQHLISVSHVKKAKKWNLVHFGTPEEPGYATRIPNSVENQLIKGFEGMFTSANLTVGDWMMKKQENGSGDSDDKYFSPCTTSETCFRHCDVCKCHLSGKEPYIQHKQSGKHANAIKRLLAKISEGGDHVMSDPFITTSGDHSTLLIKEELKGNDSQFNLPWWMIRAKRSRSEEPVCKFMDVPESSLPPKLRSYQKEIVGEALKRDTLVFLPTGTGKTMVSAVVIEKMLEVNPTKQVLFLVDKIILVLQQSEFLNRELGDKKFTRWNPQSGQNEKRHLKVIGLYGGKITANTMSVPLCQHDILVATAGYYKNLLERQALYWSENSLVVIDEAHHTNSEHVFNILTRNFHQPLVEYKRPKILGLTASPGSGETVAKAQNNIEKVLQNLGDCHLAMVEEFYEELTEFQSKSEIHVQVVGYSNEEYDIQRDLQRLFVDCLTYLQLSPTWKEIVGDMDVLAPFQDGRTATEIVSDLGISSLFDLIKGITSVQNTAARYQRPVEPFKYTILVLKSLIALEVCGILGSWYALETEHPHAFEWMMNTGIQCSEILHDVQQFQLSRDKVMQELLASRTSVFAALVDVINNGIASATNNEIDPVILVLIQERLSALCLKEIFDKCDEKTFNGPIQVTNLMGHGDGSNVGMSITEQKRVLKNIRAKRFNVIVATSVAEEGLDLPDCGLVVCLTPPKSVTSLVQIRGRARQLDSKLISICRSKGEENKFRDLFAKEKNMFTACHNIRRTQDNMDTGDIN